MSIGLIVSTGSNLGDRSRHLQEAQKELSKTFKLVESSSVVESRAVDYLDQPDFLNQVLHFDLPENSPQEILTFLMKVELRMGRRRDIPKGPRTLDLDILFFSDKKINQADLEIPHPRQFDRDFILYPLSQLKAYSELRHLFPNLPDAPKKSGLKVFS